MAKLEQLLLLAAICFDLCFFSSGGIIPQPLGFWMFDSVNQGADLSGNGNTASLTGVTYTVDPNSVANSAVTFAGNANSYAIITNNNAALSSSTSFTFMAYLMDKAGAGAPIFNFGPDTSRQLIWFCCAAGQLHTAFNRATDHVRLMDVSSGSDFFPRDTWTHAAIVYDGPGSSVKYFKNGLEYFAARRVFSSDQDDNIGQVYVGSLASDTRRMMFAVYCMMYFGDPLSPEQMSAARSLCRTYDAQSLYPWPAPVSHWPMNNVHGAYDSTNSLTTDGTSYYCPVSRGPLGEKSGSFVFNGRVESYVLVPNSGALTLTQYFTFTAYIQPRDKVGIIFRWWETAAGASNAAYLQTYPTSSQLMFKHVTTGGVGTMATSAAGSLKLYDWNFIAVSFDFTTGNSKIYINDVLQVTTSHGNNEMRTGQTFGLGEWGQTTNNYGSLEAQLACVQVYDTPLSLDSMAAAKSDCEIVQEAYNPKPWMALTFHKADGLSETGPFKRPTARTGADYSFVTGWRNRPDDAVLLTAASSLILPNSTNALSSFSVVVHAKVNATAYIKLLSINSVTEVELNIPSSGSLVLRGGGKTVTFPSIITSQLIGSYVFLGIVYNSLIGTLTVYVDGTVVKTQFAGFFTTSPGNATISVIAGEAALECYQLYDTAINQRQLVLARDLCIKPAFAGSLPFPRGFWPLDLKHQGMDVTGRSGNMVLLGGQTFNSDGPFGQANGAAHLNRSDWTSKMFVKNSRGLDVKFSSTISLWLKRSSQSISDKGDLFSFYSLDAPVGTIGGTANGATCVFPFVSSGLTYTDCIWSSSQTTTWCCTDGACINSGNCQGSVGGNGHLLTTEGTTLTSSVRPSVDLGRLQRSSPSITATGAIAYDTWTHVAFAYDYLGKWLTLYLNGKLFKRTRANRHVQRTLYAAFIGGRVVWDSSTSSYKNDVNQFEGDVSCYQWYDVALTEQQVQNSMNLCKPEVLGSFFAPSSSVSPGFSRTNPASSGAAKTVLECMANCKNNPDCDSIGFGGGQCDISIGVATSVAPASFSQTNKQYLEKFTDYIKLFY